jgi:hypothetical protein
MHALYTSIPTFNFTVYVDALQLFQFVRCARLVCACCCLWAIPWLNAQAGAGICYVHNRTSCVRAYCSQGRQSRRREFPAHRFNMCDVLCVLSLRASCVCVQIRRDHAICRLDQPAPVDQRSSRQSICQKIARFTILFVDQTAPLPLSALFVCNRFFFLSDDSWLCVVCVSVSGWPL